MPLCASIDLDRLEAIGADARTGRFFESRGAVLRLGRRDGFDEMRVAVLRVCGVATIRASRGWMGAWSSSAAPVGSDYRGFTFIHVASLRRAREEELPLWTLLTLASPAGGTVRQGSRRRRAGGVYYRAYAIDARS